MLGFSDRPACLRGWLLLCVLAKQAISALQQRILPQLYMREEVFLRTAADMHASIAVHMAGLFS
jgi:hypothetical protein